MRIGELARRAAVSTSRLRFYEGRGLLAAAERSSNGYRRYDEGALLIVRFITRAQSLGFTLAEVGTHLHLPEGTDRKAGLQVQLEAKAAELDGIMKAIQERRALVLELINEVRRLRGEH